MVQLSIKIRRNGGAAGEYKQPECADETEVTESLDESCSDHRITETPASLLELLHDNREKTQQLQMLRETLAIIKMTMSRNNALLQEKIKLLDEKTSECEQLQIKCEGLVREKAAAVALGKIKYDALLAQNEQDAIQKRSCPPSSDALLGILPEHPWRDRPTTIIAISSRCNANECGHGEEDSIADECPSDAAFRPVESLTSRSSTGSRTSRSTRRSRRSRKSTLPKTEFSTFSPVSMQWVTSAAAKGQHDATSVASRMSAILVEQNKEIDATADTEAVKAVVELPSMPQVSSAASSSTSERSTDETSDSTKADAPDEFNYNDDTELASSISSKEVEENDVEFESMWHGRNSPGNDSNEDDEKNQVDDVGDVKFSTDSAVEVFGAHIQSEQAVACADDHTVDISNKLGANVLPAIEFTSDEALHGQDQVIHTAVPDIISTTGDTISASSTDKEPVFDKRAARTLRRMIRRGSRIQRTAQKAAILAGYDIVQLEC